MTTKKEAHDIIKKSITTGTKDIKMKAKSPKLMMSQLNKLQLGNDKVLNSFAMLIDDVSEDSAKEIIQWILEANFSEETPDVLNFIICSPGGELSPTFAIIDVMKSSHIPIRTIGLGQIASAGLMIFLAGTKGMRTLTPNTSIMSHQFSGGSIGKEHELFSIVKEFDLTRNKMINHYVKYTGMKEKDVMKYLLPATDVYLTAEEAKKCGICDRIALLD
jgi:ATP-dependent Clp protease protease subunit